MIKHILCAAAALFIVSEASAAQLVSYDNTRQCVSLNVSDPLSEPVPTGVPIVSRSCVAQNPAQAFFITRIGVGDGSRADTVFLRSDYQSEGANLCVDGGHEGPDPKPGDPVEIDFCNMTPYQIFTMTASYEGEGAEVKQLGTFKMLAKESLCLALKANTLVVESCSDSKAQKFIVQ